ncbi:MAG: hypothetical protein IT450_00280 [Phycisphaerales bacterium]|nr:hypothetical protein [Phycisphaerales bacterium]
MKSASQVAFLTIPLLVTACATSRQVTHLNLEIGDPQADLSAAPDLQFSRLEIDHGFDKNAAVQLQWRAFAKDDSVPRWSFSLPVRSSGEVHAAIGSLGPGRERFHLSAIPLTLSQDASVMTSMIDVDTGDYGLVGHWRSGRVTRESGEPSIKLAQFNLWRNPPDLETSPDWRIELVMLVDLPAGEIE